MHCELLLVLNSWLTQVHEYAVASKNPIEELTLVVEQGRALKLKEHTLGALQALACKPNSPSEDELRQVKKLLHAKWDQGYFQNVTIIIHTTWSTNTKHQVNKILPLLQSEAIAASCHPESSPLYWEHIKQSFQQAAKTSMQADIGKHMGTVYAAAAKISLSAGELSSSTVVTCS